MAEVQLPKITTLIPQKEFEYVGSVVNRADLIRQSSTNDRYLELKAEINPLRLTTKKAGVGADSSYKVGELKGYAVRAGIPSAQNKDKLVEALRNYLQL